MNASADDCAGVGVYAVCVCVARHMIMFMKLTHTQETERTFTLSKCVEKT